MSAPKTMYSFSGAVMHFDRIVDNKFEAQTYASSKKQAVSNILYQFKSQRGFAPNAGKFSLVGDVKCFEEIFKNKKGEIL